MIYTVLYTSDSLSKNYIEVSPGHWKLIGINRLQTRSMSSLAFRVMIANQKERQTLRIHPIWAIGPF